MPLSIIFNAIITCTDAIIRTRNKSYPRPVSMPIYCCLHTDLVNAVISHHIYTINLPTRTADHYCATIAVNSNC